ncbi:MAG: hypothetical protein P9L94_12710 [Candidatus Hinthialibacter antarcticus]|nr:hypothetical protein [Candidatus Hinthialibacter antarcticus]
MKASASHPQLNTATPRRKSRRLLRWGVGGCLVLFAIWMFQPIDVLLNYVLVYETPMKNVDAIFITQLGETKTAADLFHNGSVKRILILHGPSPEYREADPPISPHTFIRDELLKQLTPAHAIAHLPYQATNAVDSHRLIREWVFANNVKSIVVFPPKYHSFYNKMTHEQTLGFEGIELVVRPVDENGIWRKQILSIENLFIRMAWWRLVDLPKLRAEFGYGKPLTALSEDAA